MMTDDELILRAVDAVHRLEARRERSDPFSTLKVDSLDRRHVEGSVVHFGSETSAASIDITVNRDTGEIIEASFVLPPPHVTPTV